LKTRQREGTDKINKVFVAISSIASILGLSETTNPQCRLKHELTKMNGYQVKVAVGNAYYLGELNNGKVVDNGEVFESEEKANEAAQALALRESEILAEFGEEGRLSVEVYDLNEDKVIASY
jgi:hypothetical protein